MKIALVCDSLSAYGGAERVVEQILAIYPGADVFTTIDVLPDGQRGFLGGRALRTSFLQGLPFLRRTYRKLLPLWPIAVEQLDVLAYDLVLSSHHSVAYGVLTRPGQVHVSYVHSPMRYAWDLQHEYLREAGLDRGILGFAARRALHRARIWDYTAAQRPDAIAANSRFIAERLWHTHRRRAAVIHPPVSPKAAVAAERGRSYLALGRLVPYKRFELLARAFQAMPHRHLRIVGGGPDLARIKALGIPNVEVMGFQPERTVAGLLAEARAFVYAGIEDFGISAVEAQAAGTPVVALRAGGLAEIVRGLGSPAPTGVFFEEQSIPAIVEALDRFEEAEASITPAACRANAERFNAARFRQEFQDLVEETLRAASPGSHLPARPAATAQRGADEPRKVLA